MISVEVLSLVSTLILLSIMYIYYFLLLAGSEGEEAAVLGQHHDGLVRDVRLLHRPPRFQLLHVRHPL